MNDNFKNKMMELSKKIDVQLNDEQIIKFYKYMNLLLDWNEKINLTAITEINDVILKHFIDSMTVLKYIEKEKSIIDVGTGAGFPGIPIAIMDKTKRITLLDSLNKRINFLNEVSHELNINNIETIHGRAEELGQNKKYREIYDIAVSRAVANMTTLSEYLIPFVKVGGICICMKGPDIQQEMEQAKFAIKELGGEILNIEEFVLPDSDIERNIAIIKKIKQTPSKYPRKSGMPSKMPIR
ncbi:MAG: 16S rRNA (guanine(527)-N(7))-methyltransferase RsmG [Clostridia bacterium]|nr:16S rRNA (guanine(527)-N(7))-methyltransferase RsmG [Clostridia bacterium]